MSKLTKFGLAALLGAGVTGSLAVAALSQEAAPATPPTWQTLVHCAQIGDRDDRVDCYDAAMRDAGYAPKPEAVREARHRLFGLSVPQVNILRGKGDKTEKAEKSESNKERRREAQAAEASETEDNVNLALTRVAIEGNGKLMLMTSEGQIWEQTDSEPIRSMPKPGYVMPVHRGRLGGYFCDVSKSQQVRCSRLR